MVDDILVYCCDIKIFEIDQTDLKELSELILIIGKHWLDYSKKKYPSDSTDLLQKKGINLLIKVIYPYLTKDSKKIMDSIYAPVWFLVVQSFKK